MNAKPKCIIVTGRPGSGKTTLAKKLAEQLWMPIVSRDAIKEGYVNTYSISHDQLPSDTNEVVSNLFFEIVNQHLQGGVSVVIEAAFQHKIWESRIERIQELGRPYIVICTIDDFVAAERHLQRRLADAQREFFHDDNSVSNVRKTGELPSPDKYLPPNFEIPTVKVNTIADYAPSIDDLITLVQSSGVAQDTSKL